MSAIRDSWEANAAWRSAELQCYDAELLRTNWRSAIGVLAGSEAHQDWRPQLPEDSANLEPGFMVRVRALASGI